MATKSSNTLTSLNIPGITTVQRSPSSGITPITSGFNLGSYNFSGGNTPSNTFYTPSGGLGSIPGVTPVYSGSSGGSYSSGGGGSVLGANTYTMPAYTPPPLGTPITPDALSPASPVRLPTPTPSSPTAGILSNINTGLETGFGMMPATTSLTEEEQNRKSIQDTKDLYNSIVGERPDLTGAYETAYKQNVEPMRIEVNNLKSQIGAITAQANADILAARNQSSTEGGTVGILSAREDAISRSASIKTLPLAASLAAAQDNLALAQDYLNTWFSIKKEDIDNEYEYRNKLFDSIKGDLDKKEQKQWDLQKMALQNAYTVANDTLKTQNELLANAMAQKAPAIVIQRIRDAKDSASAIIAAGSYGQKATSGGSAPTVKTINGVDMQWNHATGKWETISGGGMGGDLRLAQAQGNIQSIDTLLKNPALSSSVGPTLLARFRGKGLYKLTGDTANFASGVQQLISQLSLDSLNRAKAQGATFGALSEGELRTLASSASKLEGWAKKDSNGNITAIKASEKDFKAEMDRINNLAKLDYLLKGGSPSDINVQVTPDGKYWTLNSDGTLTELK